MSETKKDPTLPELVLINFEMTYVTVNCNGEYYDSIGTNVRLFDPKHRKSVLSLVDAISSLTAVNERSLEQFQGIFNEYLEKPTLLEGILNEITTKLFEFVQNSGAVDSPAFVHASYFLFVLIKTRGFKSFLPRFPSSVDHLSFVVDKLEQGCSRWQINYLFLLWLSVLVTIPFDLIAVDPATGGGNDSQMSEKLPNRILRICRKFLDVSIKTRDAACLVVGRVLVRRDMTDELKNFTEEMFGAIENSSHRMSVQLSYTYQSALMCLAQLLKYADRDYGRRYCAQFVAISRRCDLQYNDESLVRKLNVKVLQRFASLYCIQQANRWRYCRRKRILFLKSVSAPSSNSTNDVEDYSELPPCFEDIIDSVFTSLTDKTYVVRWSAAKGIARLVELVPETALKDIIIMIVNCLSFQENLCYVQGACLAIAELARRGLLLPCHLELVVPPVVNALNFDLLLVNCSIGSCVRDAACYVFWAFARSFEPEILQPYILDIAKGLIVVAIFDRELSCRHAASAAFQEIVGRLKTIPHGIDILTIADYFNVCQIEYCYLELSGMIAKFPEYTRVITSHVVEVKTIHWNEKVRNLAARCIYKLANDDLDYMIKTAIPLFFSRCRSNKIAVIHGSLLALAQSLYAISQKQSLKPIVNEEMVSNISQILRMVAQYESYFGLNKSIIHEAGCSFIKFLCFAKLDLSKDIEVCKQILMGALRSDVQKIKFIACEAFSHFIEACYTEAMTDELYSCAIELLRTCPADFQADRCGFFMLLGSFPLYFLEKNFSRVTDDLIMNAKKKAQFKRHALARKIAVETLFKIVKEVILNNRRPFPLIDSPFVSKFTLFHIYMMRDYTIDGSGDAGRIVRETAIRCITMALPLMAEHGYKQFLDKRFITQVLNDIVIQSLERIDTTRRVASTSFVGFIHDNMMEEFLPDVQNLKSIFPSTEVFYKNVYKLLQVDEFRMSVLYSLIVSGGCFSECIANGSISILSQHINQFQRDFAQMDALMNDLIRIWKKHYPRQKVYEMYLQTMLALLSTDVFLFYANNSPRAAEFFKVILTSIDDYNPPNASVEVEKAKISIFCTAFQFTFAKSLNLFEKLYPYFSMCPVIREHAISCLYAALITYVEVIDQEKIQPALSLLSSDEWTKTNVNHSPLVEKISFLIKSSFINDDD